MKIPFVKNLASASVALSVSVIGALGLSGCGGGGGSEDSSPPTIRPKTLDGIVLSLETAYRFEFLRNVGSAAAAQNGDVETGTFFYTKGGVQRRTYPNLSGDNSDCRYPDSISTASYTFRAINESSGVLTLTGVGVNDLATDGTFAANNGSFCYFFNSDSNGVVNFNVQIDLTFSSNGTYVNTATSTVQIPGSTAPNYDIVRIPTSILLATGGAVPENYNPKVDPLRPSRVTPESLDNLLFKFTNGIPDPNFDFTIQFVADTQLQPQVGGNTVDEVGQGVLRVGNVAVQDAVDYTWKRVSGTDDGILTITGSNSTFDGSYTLKFAGVDNGVYIGQLDGDTVNAAEVSGTFTIPANAP